VATAIRDELTFLSFPITKWDKTDDGDLIVVGKATDGSVDSDEQIVDPAWSAKALTDWLDSGGNVRVQHQAMRDPAGKGLSVEIDKDGDGGHWVKSLVVEPVAKRLVEKGVLTSYSVGIARPVVMRDPSGKARGGIVTGGHLAELSLVDRPANKNCQLVIAKAAGDSVELVGELVGDPDWIAKIADEEDLLVKASSNGSGPAADDASQAASDSGDADDDNDSDDDDDDGDDDNDDDAASKTEEPGAADLIAAADNETRAAYKAARTQWLSCEPTVKGIAHGTEYLAKRADWMRWQAEGDAEGLAGTREGAERWLAKRADDDLLAKAEAADAAETALLKTLDVADKRFFSAERRRQLAHQGNSLPDGSYPIPDADALRRAAVLARSGHGNVAAARRLISRRAKELGVPNPLKESDAVKKTDGESSSSSDGKPCGTCHGDGKIMGNNRTCPDCNGTGKMTAKTDTPALAADADAAEASPDSKTARKAAKTARREAALAALADTVTKTVEAGLITREAADEIIATAAAESAVKAKKKRQLPADVAPARPHREPDGTSTVEDFEPDAGLPTDPDRTPDKIPVSVSSHDHTGPPPAGKPRTKTDDSAPYRIGRLHDLTCAAYDPAETLAGYPSLKSFSDAVDVAWFADQAAAVAAAGKAAEAAYLAGLVADAQYVKDADPAAIADGLGLLRKAFTDMYPTLNITPQSGIRPGSYQRPYLTAGHAAETAERNGSANIPPSSKVPEPEQFHRPLITDGHEADSPANKEDNFPIPPRTGAVRTYYTNQQRDNAKAALQAMHDHIAGSFPDLCPMAASKSVIPPDLGAANVPQPVTVTSQGGIPAAGKTTEPDVMSLAEMQGVIADAIRRHNARGGMPVTVKPVMTRKRIEKAAARLGLDIVERHAPPAETTAVPVQPGLTAAELKALLTEQFTPLVEAHETQITELRKQIDEIGSRPDPAMAPVRGALARMPAETAVPVERRSLIDEHADHVRKMAEAEQAQYRAYVEALAKSPDPGVREAALATLDKMLTPTQTAPGI
jgi:hypothetical protein